MANTKQPELKEPGPSDNQLPDFKKSHVRLVFPFLFNLKKTIFLFEEN